MNNQITATEVQMRMEEWKRVNQPRINAWYDKLLKIIWGDTIQYLNTWLQDQELQQQRMTDDGCPL